MPSGCLQGIRATLTPTFGPSGGCCCPVNNKSSSVQLSIRDGDTKVRRRARPGRLGCIEASLIPNPALHRALVSPVCPDQEPGTQRQRQTPVTWPPTNHLVSPFLGTYRVRAKARYNIARLNLLVQVVLGGERPGVTRCRCASGEERRNEGSADDRGKFLEVRFRQSGVSVMFVSVVVMLRVRDAILCSYVSLHWS